MEVLHKFKRLEYLGLMEVDLRVKVFKSLLKIQKRKLKANVFQALKYPTEIKSIRYTALIAA
jgi:hypothetical protein